MCITASSASIIGSRTNRRAAEQRLIRLHVGWEMAGEGNPDDPAQARSQMSEHVQSGGALAGPTGARFRRYALSVVTRFSSLLECCRIADRLNGNGAAKTAFVHLCLPKWATVDTTFLSCTERGVSLSQANAVLVDKIDILFDGGQCE